MNKIDGRKVRLLREQRGWSQQELGTRARLAQGTVSRIEAGIKTELRLSTLEKLAQVFGVHTDELLTGTPKTASSERPIPLCPTVLAALKRQQTRCKELRLAAGPRWQQNDLVCPRDDGALLHAPAYNKNWFRKLTAAADLEGVTPHLLRHTFASLLGKQGTSPRAAQDLLGHSSPSITLGIYTHSMLDERAEAIGRLEGLISR